MEVVPSVPAPVTVPNKKIPKELLIGGGIVVVILIIVLLYMFVFKSDETSPAPVSAGGAPSPTGRSGSAMPPGCPSVTTCN
jgi:hypothetical protein